MLLRVPDFSRAWAEQHQQHGGDDHLRHVAQGHFLKLRGDLENADDEPDDQDGEQDRSGDDHAGPQHAIEQAQCAPAVQFFA